MNPTRRKFHDGQTFGKWTIITAYPSDSRNALCRCECGRVKYVARQHLKSGASRMCQSCALNMRYKNTPREELKCYKDGRLEDPLYQAWWSMKSRCLNPKHRSYPRYGGRGITICDEWLDFPTFRQWASEHNWQKGLQIDRVDNDGNYCPENCRFVTPKENANNRSNCRMLTFNGKTQSVSKWADELGYEPNVIYLRLRMGWPVERTLTAPVQHKKRG